jgi:hypothetical protein
MRVMHNAGGSDFDELPTEVEDDEVVATTVSARRYRKAAVSFNEEDTDPLTTVAKRSTLKAAPPAQASPPPAQRPAPPSVLTPLVPLDAIPPAWRAPLGAVAPAEASPPPAWHAGHVSTEPVEPIDAAELLPARPRRRLGLVAALALTAGLLGAGAGRITPPTHWRYERAQAELSRARGWLTTTFKWAKASFMASASETDVAIKADRAPRDGARAVVATEAVDEAR